MTNSIYLQDIKEYFHIYIVQMFFFMICSYFNNGAILQINGTWWFFKNTLPSKIKWSYTQCLKRSALNR